MLNYFCKTFVNTDQKEAFDAKKAFALAFKPASSFVMFFFKDWILYYVAVTINDAYFY